MYSVYPARLSSLLAFRWAVNWVAKLVNCQRLSSKSGVNRARDNIAEVKGVAPVTLQKMDMDGQFHR